MKKVLSREDILNAQDIVYEECHAPEWGGVFYVKGLNGAERDTYEKSNFVRRRGNFDLNLAEIRARLFVLTACDANHNLLFTSADIPRLQEKSSAVVDRGCDIARRLAGITKADEDEMAQGYDVKPNGNGNGAIG